MRIVYYGIAAIATVLAGLLWLFVLRQTSHEDAAQPARDMSTAPATATAGVLPIVPKIRLAVTPESLLVDFDQGRVTCLGGFYARSDDGQLVIVTIDDHPVPCS